MTAAIGTALIVAGVALGAEVSGAGTTVAVDLLAVTVIVLAAVFLAAWVRALGDRNRDKACPCCTGRPMEFDDCTCREDCGEAWCQAADIGDDTEPWPEPRPECPWCDTRECIDKTLCNCLKKCGSWLCVIKEVPDA